MPLFYKACKKVQLEAGKYNTEKRIHVAETKPYKHVNLKFCSSLCREAFSPIRDYAGECDDIVRINGNKYGIAGSKMYKKQCMVVPYQLWHEYGMESSKHPNENNHPSKVRVCRTDLELPIFKIPDSTVLEPS